MPLPDAETLFTQLVKKIQADNKDKHFSLVGIHTGGAWLAERLHQALVTSPSSSRDAPESRENLGMLGVSFYRDDFDKIGLHAQIKSSDIPFPVDGAHILLVDDVLQSGRTIRAAINELFDYGRPASISLAVLVDRGGRELPVCAQYIGAVLQLPKERNLVFNRDDQGKFYFSMEDVEDKNGSECDDKGVPT